MPVNNNLFGVYKSFKLNNNKLVAASVTRNRQMEASAVNFLQGTPKSRVMDIKGVSETLTVNAPLLVGAGASVDGRFIANSKINEILNPSTAKLPLLSSAAFNIGADSANVTLTLESDGDPNNVSAFEISSAEVPELDPVTYGPTRLAKFYDFRVQIGSRKYFITKADITVSADIEKLYFFIPGDWNDYRGWGDPTIAGSAVTNTGIGSTNITIDRCSGAGITFQPGTQFPFMGVGGIKINGSGEAAVLLENLTDSGGTGASTFLDDCEAINLSLKPGTTDITLQDPGIARYENANFKIEIFDPKYLAAGGSGWTSFLTPSVDTSRSIVNTSNFSLKPGLMTVDFNFICWVK